MIAVLLMAGICLCNSAFGEILYTVSNLNSSGTGSFAAAISSSNSDGQGSRIEFSVGGTIHPSARYNLTAGNCTICATDAPSPGITIDCDNARSAFNVTSGGNRFCNLKIINTITNSDGITLQGANNVVERCTFDYCRDEAVGITGASARGNVVAFCRIEHCGSQPGDGTNYANGRGILVTVNSSATIVGSYVYYCCRGITVNGNFGDIRNCRVDNSLSPASGHGVTITGSSVQGNMINCSANNNALCGFRPKSGCTFYRSGLSGSGNANGLISIDADCTEAGSPITVGDTPFPSWLSGASTPTQASDVGMGTGDCQCYAGGGQTKATNPNPANGSTSVSLTADLSWTAGEGATSHDVYFGTSSSSPTFRGNQAGTTYDTGTMANGTTYYWRIDEVGEQTITGDLWHFTTIAGQTKAINPSPSNGATSVSATVDLSWTAGTGATSHDVYFGTNSASLTYQGNQSGTTYDPGALANSTTYYWRIDEVGAQTITGDVWNFTTIEAGVPPADYYVNGATGSDTNPGTSPSQPWATIEKAVASMTAGKTVLVYPGTYAEDVLHNSNHGTSGSPITYRAYYESGAVIINATGKTFGFKSTKAYVTFDGFEVYGANANGVLIGVDAADYNIVRNCRLRNNGADGVKIDAGDNCTVQNCLIYDNSNNGIEVVSNADGATIDNCTIHSNNSNDGIHAANSDTTVVDCIITSNTQWGIDTYGTVAVGVTYTDTWGNTSGSYDDLTKITVGTGCKNQDPLFVNPGSGDFHLQAGSPCDNTASDGGDMGYRYP